MTSTSFSNGESGLSVRNKINANFLGLDNDVAGKQATLVSGTNIKTINGDSILGSGNLVVSGGGGGGITNAQSIVNALIFG